MNKILGIKLNSLLQKLYQYYPIGVCDFNNGYFGFNKIDEITTKKLDSLHDNENNEWKKLFDDINKKYLNCEIIDLSYHQFPNYVLQINIFSKEFDGVVINRSIQVVVSLLVENYTIFFIDNFGYLLNDSGKSRPYYSYSTASIFLNYVSNNPHINMFFELRLLIEKSFIGYEFIEHDFLFNTKIQGGTPFKEENIPSFGGSTFSIMRYLFANINTTNVTILK